MKENLSIKAFRNKIDYFLDKDEMLLRHGLTITIANFLAMIINYFYQLIAGRLLGPENYSIFGSLIAITTIFSIFGGVINTSIAKFCSEHKEDYGKIKTIFYRYSIKLFIIGFLIFAFFIISIPQISNLLGIDSSISLLMIGVLIPISFISSLYSGVMRGLQMFYKYSILLISQPIFKFALGIPLIILGYSVFGALFGLVFSSILTCIVSFFFLLFLLKYEQKAIEEKDIISYSLPVLIISICITAMINFDIVLVKAFFSEREAGFYIAASTLMKVIFWVSGSIVFVMFPKISSKKENASKILKGTLLYVIMFAILVITAVMLFSDFVTTLTFGEDFKDASLLMLPFSIAITIISINQVIANYSLAIEKSLTYISTAFILSTIVQIYLITSFHPSLFFVIYEIIIVNILLFIALSMKLEIFK